MSKTVEVLAAALVARHYDGRIYALHRSKPKEALPLESDIAAWVASINHPEIVKAENTALPILHIVMDHTVSATEIVRGVMNRLFLHPAGQEPLESMCRRLSLMMQRMRTRLLILDGVASVCGLTEKHAAALAVALMDIQRKLGVQVLITGSWGAIDAMSQAGCKIEWPAATQLELEMAA